MKKFFVITVLFALPLVAYLFFASGVNNFARLPVLNSEIQPLEEFESMGGDTVSFENHITILGFPGNKPMDYLTNAYHLAEKIYDPYSEFKDFHFVSVVPEGNEEEIEKLKKELSTVIGLKKWKFVTASEEEVKQLFESLGSNLELSEDLSTPNVFIIDKDAKLRGRKDDEDVGKLYGYDTNSIAVLNNKMNDDVKVILAEYRLELKKYNEKRKK
ncbi:hypothetical protein V6B16_04100 [Salinimicrobium catena]|uniref:hypothetical protein n=1 Tax=Salinimicrobium catena TaxID=390640 RepID=UPI002FE4C56F